jgi:invasion protein IalB
MNRQVSCALLGVAVLGGAVLIAGTGGAAAEEPWVRVAPHEAKFGAWVVRCDQCNSFEESVCYLWQESTPASLYFYAFAAEPQPDSPLAMEYVPSRALALDTEGVLTVTVDGTVAAEIAHPDVTYMAMYDDLHVEEAPTTALLPTLRAGRTLTLSFSDADGTGADSFALSGFAAALDDMRAQLPLTRPTLEEWAQSDCAG